MISHTMSVTYFYFTVQLQQVGELEPVLMPVSMTVKGCPLNFQMTAANPEQSTVLRQDNCRNKLNLLMTGTNTDQFTVVVWFFLQPVSYRRN